MKTNQHFDILYILLAVAQVVICNYFRLSPLISVSVLPAMVLCIPTGRSTVAAMLMAFVTGLGVDMISDGIIGLNTFALVPVAFIRKPLIRLILGNEAIEKEENLSLRYDGLGKISILLLTVLAVFLSIYILADGAGVRPLWFNVSRFAASLACSYLLSLLIVHVLSSDGRK